MDGTKRMRSYIEHCAAGTIERNNKAACLHCLLDSTIRCCVFFVFLFQFNTTCPNRLISFSIQHNMPQPPNNHANIHALTYGLHASSIYRQLPPYYTLAFQLFYFLFFSTDYSFLYASLILLHHFFNFPVPNYRRNSLFFLS